MVQQSRMARTPASSTQEIQMDTLESQSLQAKYAKRKSRFKRSDGSTSSDTTSNSFVRQVRVILSTAACCSTQCESERSQRAGLS
ncbi:voltage-dependent L-type calcium channel subunit beta-1 [Ascaphus truei]|uniref:voltage-dependent L-type calcium channel subunit beta-1 n=1 Tax=Ascaphus truei TaxID=8439 RepID=UPI003F5AB447